MGSMVSLRGRQRISGLGRWRPLGCALIALFCLGTAEARAGAISTDSLSIVYPGGSSRQAVAGGTVFWGYGESVTKVECEFAWSRGGTSIVTANRSDRTWRAASGYWYPHNNNAVTRARGIVYYKDRNGRAQKYTSSWQYPR